MFFSDVIDRFKRLGLGILGAYLVLVLLVLGAAAVGFLVIGPWDNLVILLMMILVPAILLGFLYYLMGELFSVPRAQLPVVVLFLGGLVVALISRSRDSVVILELIILSCAAFFVLLCCAIHFIPSLRERKGVFLGMGIGMWTGIGGSYALWGPNLDSYLFCWLVTACVAVGGYLGHKMVDEKSEQ